MVQIVRVNYEEGIPRFLAKDEDGWCTTGRDGALEFATEEEAANAVREARKVIPKATFTFITLGQVDAEGKRGIHSEMVVLSADTPTKKLGFVCREYLGTEIHLYEEGRQYERDERGRWLNLEPITDENALEAGVKILVHGLFGELRVMVVEASEQGKLHAIDLREDGSSEKGLMGVLSFGEDDRKAWVCGGLINLRGLKRLKLVSEEQPDA